MLPPRRRESPPTHWLRAAEPDQRLQYSSWYSARVVTDKRSRFWSHFRTRGLRFGCLHPRQQHLQRMTQCRAVDQLRLATARIPGRSEAALVTRVGHQLRPAELVDRFRVVPVGRLVTVEASHAAATGAQDAQVHAESSRHLHPVVGRGRRIGPFRAMRQQEPGAGGVARELRQVSQARCQPFLRQRDLGKDLLVERLGVLGAISERHRRIHADERHARRGQGVQRASVGGSGSLETCAENPARVAACHSA